MENFDQVEKFERIAEESAGTTAEKMDIYSDSLEASKNRVKVATEQLTQDLFGGSMDDALKSWNDILASIIKNIKSVLANIVALTFIVKVLKSGTMFGGLAKLFQSLTVSASSFKSTMATVGTNAIKWTGVRTTSEAKVGSKSPGFFSTIGGKISGSKLGTKTNN